MKKKLKNEICSEIEKEDNYQNKLNKVKYHLSFADKKKKKRGYTFWLPILVSCSAVLFVAIFVPTYMAVNSNTINGNMVADNSGLPLEPNSSKSSTEKESDVLTSADITEADAALIEDFASLNVAAVDSTKGRSFTLVSVTFDFYPCVLESKLPAMVFKNTAADGSNFEYDSLNVSIDESPSEVIYPHNNELSNSSSSSSDGITDYSMGVVIVDIETSKDKKIGIEYKGESVNFGMSFFSISD